MAVRERMLVYSPQDEYLFDIPYSQIYDGSIRERINGEHTMSLVTPVVLEKEQRVIWRDGMNKWREYVITSVDKAHANGGRPVGTYKGVWSLQHDLQVCQVSRMPGVQNPVQAAVALEAALDGTDRWQVGQVTMASYGGASMYDMQAWDALKVLVEVWGGEVDARITVNATGVSGRYVDYHPQIGKTSATRRFTYARDMTEIRRVVEDGAVACRIVPRGKGEETGDGYGRKIKIGDVNGGIDWLQNNASAALYRMPDGNGGYEYPTVFADNGDIEDKQELLDWGLSVLNDYTTPKVTYKANVLQLHAAGMNVHGIALGDAVQCADKKFSEEGLIIEGRVTELVTYFRDSRRNDVTIGYISEPIAVKFAKVGTNLSERLDGMSQKLDKTTYTVLFELLDEINQQINASGGYTYLVNGIGAVTYDTVVTDPSVGSEATQSVEMRGGTLRFSNTKTSSGDWNWTNVITADGYLGLAATIARLTSGFIGSATSGNYWNLDTGELRMAANTTSVGNQTLAQYIGDNLGLDQQDVFDLLTNNGALQGLYMSNGQLYMNATYIKTGSLNANLITSGKIQSANGKVYFDLTNNELVCDKLISTSNLTSLKNLVMEFSSYTDWSITSYGLLLKDTTNASKALLIMPSVSSRWSGNGTVARLTSTDGIELETTRPSNSYSSAYNTAEICMYRSRIDMGTAKHETNAGASYYTASVTFYGQASNGYTLGIGVNGNVRFSGAYNNSASNIDWSGYAPSFESLYARGTKSRVVTTKNYGDRLLHAYETPTPRFADIGSATIGPDGTCIVSIDDIFSEAARTDMAYQVFLQKCGRGDLWVADKQQSYFMVEGTPGISFDWQISAHQNGYETARIDDAQRYVDAEAMGKIDPTSEDEHNVNSDGIEQLESMYQDEIDEYIYASLT